MYRVQSLVILITAALVLSGTGTAITAKVINGTQKADRLGGTNGNDVIHGLGGNDKIGGKLGNDSLYGDAGNDHLADGGSTSPSQPERDKVFGGPGDDELKSGPASAGREDLDGGPGNDTLLSLGGGSISSSGVTPAVVYMLGGDGNDYLNLGSPTLERVSGGPGNDTIMFFDVGEGDRLLPGGCGEGIDSINVRGVPLGQQSSALQQLQYDFGCERVSFS